MAESMIELCYRIAEEYDPKNPQSRIMNRRMRISKWAWCQSKRVLYPETYGTQRAGRDFPHI